MCSAVMRGFQSVESDSLIMDSADGYGTVRSGCGQTDRASDCVLLDYRSSDPSPFRQTIVITAPGTAT